MQICCLWAWAGLETWKRYACLVEIFGAGFGSTAEIVTFHEWIRIDDLPQNVCSLSCLWYVELCTTTAFRNSSYPLPGDPSVFEEPDSYFDSYEPKSDYNLAFWRAVTLEHLVGAQIRAGHDTSQVWSSDDSISISCAWWDAIVFVPMIDLPFLGVDCALPVIEIFSHLRAHVDARRPGAHSCLFKN